MSRCGCLLVLVAVGALLPGCAGRVEPLGPAVPAPGATGPTTTAPEPADPVGLIGSWKVAGVEGDAGAILRLAPRSASLFDRCGARFGAWRADAAGLFVADVDPSSGGGAGCDPSSGANSGWLNRAVGFRLDGRNPILLDGQGRQVARLLPGARPTAGPGLAPSEVEPPVVTDEVRRALVPAVEVAAPLVPATRDALTGRWVPVGGRAPEAYVELRPTGEWTGSDGCNGTGGRWVAGPAGALLATTGASTLIGCDNVPVGGWLGDTRRAGLHAEVLVLLDASGTEIGRLRRG